VALRMIMGQILTSFRLGARAPIGCASVFDYWCNHCCLLWW